ncbi:MAG: putative endonuclease [Candidatus Berkelbacteria bacterium Athens1014_28]|uniref:UPF0102 protein Athens101428_277 n=1 Tax=Candidatus Berkelbacteria bacterium Athens1014_28 TaxID=2017145 RepID=A0A554LNI7_9BACT|nr:MAG: putative endonuclease [Candidatus Berkelbacteria bacterium Athens1014_28]
MDRSQNKSIGNVGEELAAEFLRREKYKILGRNINYPFGEIDILARDRDGAIVIVEVKTVRGFGWGGAADLVRHSKQQKLRLLARAITQEFPKNNLRIDVIAIDGDEINHIKNAVF